MANGGSGSWSFAAGGAGGGGIVSAGGGGGSASISSTGVIGGSSFSRAMSEEEIKKLKAELAQHRKAQVILPDG